MRVVYNTSVTYRSGFSEDDLAEMDAMATRVLQTRGDLGLNPLKLSEQVLADVMPLQTTFEERTADLRDLEADLRIALERYPESIDMHMLLAQNLKDQGRFDEAAAHMKEQADRHPGHSEWAGAHVWVYADYSDYFATNAERLAARRSMIDLQRQYAGLPVAKEYEDVLWRDHKGPTYSLVDEEPESVTSRVGGAARAAMSKVGDWFGGPDEPH